MPIRMNGEQNHLIQCEYIFTFPEAFWILRIGSESDPFWTKISPHQIQQAGR